MPYISSTDILPEDVLQSLGGRKKTVMLTTTTNTDTHMRIMFLVASTKGQLQSKYISMHHGNKTSLCANRKVEDNTGGINDSALFISRDSCFWNTRSRGSLSVVSSVEPNEMALTTRRPAQKNKDQ